MDPTTEACGGMSTIIMGWCPLPFWSPWSITADVCLRKFSLTSGVVILSLYFSRACLLPLSLFLEYLGESKVVLLHLTKHQLSDPGSHLFPTSVLTAVVPRPLDPESPEEHPDWHRGCSQSWDGPLGGIAWDGRKREDEWTRKRVSGQLSPSVMLGRAGGEAWSP